MNIRLLFILASASVVISVNAANHSNLEHFHLPMSAYERQILNQQKSQEAYLTQQKIEQQQPSSYAPRAGEQSRKRVRTITNLGRTNG